MPGSQAINLAMPVSRLSQAFAPCAENASVLGHSQHSYVRFSRSRTESGQPAAAWLPGHSVCGRAQALDRHVSTGRVAAAQGLPTRALPSWHWRRSADRVVAPPRPTVGQGSRDLFNLKISRSEPTRRVTCMLRATRLDLDWPAAGRLRADVLPHLGSPLDG